MNKKAFKYHCVLIVIAIVFYKLLDQPIVIFDTVNYVSQLIKPFVIGVFLAILLNPVVKTFNQKLNVKRGLSILFTYILAIIMLICVGVIIVPSIGESVRMIFLQLSEYVSDPELIIMNVNDLIPYVNINSEELVVFMSDSLNTISQSLIGMIDTVSTAVVESILDVTSQVINVIVGITVSIYLLIDERKVIKVFRRFLKVYLPKRAEKINYFVTFSYHLFQDYMVGRLLDSLIIGILAYFGFLIIGSPYVMLFAFIIGITNIIPYFGPIIGGILPILMTLFIDPIQAIWVSIFILCLQQLDGNVIGPKIMGDRVGLSPLLVICAVTVGGAMFGFMGFFLAVPVVAVLKELYEVTTDARSERLEKELTSTKIITK